VGVKDIIVEKITRKKCLKREGVKGAVKKSD